MTYENYIDAVQEAYKANPSWRMGQTYFNVLMDAAPDLAEEIRGTDLDPFHRDEVLPSFTLWLQTQLAAPHS